MTKFNVGDKVQFIEDYMDYKKGDVVEVIGFWAEGINYVGKHGRGGAYYNRFELVESKPTKNQRITALENEVAELKLIVHELRDKKVTTTATVFLDGVPVDINNAPEIQLKAAPTPNQQRAAIIEKAMKFVETNTFYNGRAMAGIGVKLKSGMVCIPEFIINDTKRTVVVLFKWVSNARRIQSRGIAKCNPSDVFNEHIGKAIALGRALGLNVSEFEQAVQPTKAVLGTVVGHRSKEGIFRTVAPNFVLGKTCTLGSDTAKYGKIINDTNAKYEEG